MISDMNTTAMHAFVYVYDVHPHMWFGTLYPWLLEGHNVTLMVLVLTLEFVTSGNI